MLNNRKMNKWFVILFIGYILFFGSRYTNSMILTAIGAGISLAAFARLLYQAFKEGLE